MGRLSNVAKLTVSGEPQPGAALRLFDFEDGTQAWAGASFETNTGTTSTTTAFASDGVQSLHIARNNAWFTGPLGGANWTGAQHVGVRDVTREFRVGLVPDR